jgi:hypothetical protein
MGLEPTTFAVTGRRCNRLNYAPADRIRPQELSYSRGKVNRIGPFLSGLSVALTQSWVLLLRPKEGPISMKKILLSLAIASALFATPLLHADCDYQDLCWYSLPFLMSATTTVVPIELTSHGQAYEDEAYLRTVQADAAEYLAEGGAPSSMLMDAIRSVREQVPAAHSETDQQIARSILSAKSSQ